MNSRWKTLRGLLVAGCLVAALPATRSAEPGSKEKDVPDSPEKIVPLEVGAKIPRVTLTAPDGSPFDLNAAVARKPSVVVFYRGGW